ncbi:MAG: DNA-3-methyladenine glycosylase 2 family protein [Proteobacteria bacterium]|nr:DNA-3-methyladenine glycosylase 2 family protein [Pseudomonadota bacterium]
MRADAEAEVVIPGVIDLRRTLLAHSVWGSSVDIRASEDRVDWAIHTEEGPSALAFVQLAADRVGVKAWGPGAENLVEGAPDVLGVHDRPESFDTEHPLLRDLARRYRGVRFGASRRVWPRLVSAVIGQMVTSKGAARSFRELVRAYGEPAPGPAGLTCVPTAAALRRLSYFEFTPCGIERKRAQTLMACARRPGRLEQAIQMSGEEALEWLQRFPGIGPWTAALVVSSSHGDADCVVVGDYHLPNHVTFNLAGRPRGTDAEMLELLEPYRPHRGRVLRIIKHGGKSPPKYGPRSDVRNIR